MLFAEASAVMTGFSRPGVWYLTREGRASGPGAGGRRRWWPRRCSRRGGLAAGGAGELGVISGELRGHDVQAAGVGVRDGGGGTEVEQDEPGGRQETEEGGGGADAQVEVGGSLAGQGVAGGWVADGQAGEADGQLTAQ